MVSPAPTSVTVTPGELKLVPNATKTLAASVLPAAASQAVIWASENTSVATVEGSGITATVTGVAVGTARITAAAVGFPAIFGVCEVGVSVAVMPPATLAGGNYHSMGIKENSGLWAWGDNYYAQFGDGTSDGSYTPIQVGNGTSDWVGVSGSYTHTVAIRVDGSLWAWGTNQYGQLGNGTVTENSNVPTQVDGGGVWAAVSAHGNHSLAIRADGSLWAWGWNAVGQLGDGTNADRSRPVQVGDGASDWFAVAAGATHTLAVRDDGSLWAWGMNSYGQLGLGDTTNRNAPQRVGDANDWATVATGTYHTLAIKKDGSIWAWGQNNYGQLGLGNTTNQNAPQRVGEGVEWASVAAGATHTLAVRDDGSLWAWGRNNYGQLGLGNMTNRSDPRRVGEGVDWTYVAAGAYHSLALKSDGSLWAWGYNSYGQIGNYYEDASLDPVKVGDGWRVPAN
jgi:alpha-tubulin suppressor-like RCC1 family protein